MLTAHALVLRAPEVTLVYGLIAPHRTRPLLHARPTYTIAHAAFFMAAGRAAARGPLIWHAELMGHAAFNPAFPAAVLDS